MVSYLGDVGSAAKSHHYNRNGYNADGADMRGALEKNISQEDIYTIAGNGWYCAGFRLYI